MNGAQLHLLLNHIPVFLPVTGALVLGLGLVRRSQDIQFVGLLILVIGALGTLPTYFTGEPAERVVKNYPQVNRMAIDAHEDAALWALIFIEAGGALSLGTMILNRMKRTVSTKLLWAIVVIGLFSFVVVARTAHLGGLIRHEELESRSNGNG